MFINIKKKMMKKTIYGAIAGCTLGLVSCAQIDIEPLSQPTKETWYKNAKEIRMSTDALYSYKQWILESKNPFNLDTWTDDWFQNGAIADPGPTGNLASDLALIVNYWKTTYGAINNANIIIESCSRLADSAEATEISQIEGEAKFLRATFYSYILFFWGDCPYYTGDITISEAEAMGRTPKEEVLRKIYQDYDEAYELLPETNIGKACKSTVAPFKARVALWMGDWRTAADEAWKCIESKAYSLDKSFADVTSPDSNSEEWILTLKRSASLDNSSRFPTTNYVPRIVSGYTGNRGPSWELLLSFLCTDGLPVDKSPLYDPHNPFRNRDPRCAETIVPFGEVFLGFEYNPGKEKVLNVATGKKVKNSSSPLVDNGAPTSALHLKKGVDETWIDDKYAENQVPVLRFADVLLTYAEAKVELGEIDDSVLKAINDVRSRAYNGTGITAPKVETKDQSELRSQIRFERRMEFAFENKRYFDIIRWRLAETCMNRPMYQCLQGVVKDSDLSKQVASGDFFFTNKALPIVDENALVDVKPLLATGTIRQHIARSFPKRQYLFPIPVYDIMTAPAMKQNDGY